MIRRNGTIIPTSELTAAQVAARYGVTAATVYGWCRRGLVAAIKQGRRWLIDPAVTADLPTERAQVITRQAVVDYRRPATAKIPVSGTSEQVAKFNSQMAAVGARRDMALARLRVVGRSDVANALVEEAASRGIGTATAEHRRATARRVIAAALAPVAAPKPADPVDLFNELGADFAAHKPRYFRTAG